MELCSLPSGVIPASVSGALWAAYDRRLELDHVLIAVVDLAAAAHEFEVEHGLASIEGGRHPGWGTANRIVPLGRSYLELVAIVDEDEAAESDFGHWVAAVDAESGSRPFGWAVRTNDLNEVAQRLGLNIEGGSRVTPEGEEVRWRAAGLEQPAAGCTARRTGTAAPIFRLAEDARTQRLTRALAHR